MLYPAPLKLPAAAGSFRWSISALRLLPSALTLSADTHSLFISDLCLSFSGTFLPLEKVSCWTLIIACIWE